MKKSKVVEITLSGTGVFGRDTVRCADRGWRGLGQGLIAKPFVTIDRGFEAGGGVRRVDWSCPLLWRPPWLNPGQWLPGSVQT